ncbi:hypothetical protein BELL_1310g00030 [Botrytis elliptica]|uniref:Uncharacterized protein n=1 Tax=Botrytis elliptica TaxID=278938 RepID=A0A4Z1I901_9HELO|nr:hypothetical protein EAE99_005764 [Botrytis elliptica]TGO58089.1 hypothetical protein BELL_1310g00030 [Botrytis elliptica]
MIDPSDVFINGNPQIIKDAAIENLRPVSVIVIGAGFSGIYCGVRISERLRNVNLKIYEKNDGVGGTWYENRYPGCACDIPSHSYQYTFAPNPNWSSFYAPAPEIRQYLEDIVKRFSVDRFIKCSHEVIGAQWDDKKAKWKVQVKNLETGETITDEADVVISARGTLNNISWPKIEGLSDIKIPVMHSAAWDMIYDFKNKRIGVIGGGSSAIQIIPSLQKVPGAQLSCYIRSKTWISRPFGDIAMEKLGIKETYFSAEQKARFASDPEHYLEFRTIIARDANSAHVITLKGSKHQETARDNFTELMKERLAKKPEIFKALLPTFSVGCRRLTPGPGYLEALVEDNVDFLDTPILKASTNGLILKSGEERELDVLVCATGFQASAPPVFPPVFPVIGRNGQSMKEKFEPWPKTYLSLATDGFPNYFMVLGPNAAIGTGSLTVMMEMTGDYIIKCIRKIQKENTARMEVQRRRVQDFSRIIDHYFQKTVYVDDCNSWYRSNGGKGDRVTGLWPGSTLHAMECLRSPRWEDFDYLYEGENDGEECNRLAWI